MIVFRYSPAAVQIHSTNAGTADFIYWDLLPVCGLLVASTLAPPQRPVIFSCPTPPTLQFRVARLNGPDHDPANLVASQRPPPQTASLAFDLHQAAAHDGHGKWRRRDPAQACRRWLHGLVGPAMIAPASSCLRAHMPQPSQLDMAPPAHHRPVAHRQGIATPLCSLPLRHVQH